MLLKPRGSFPKIGAMEEPGVFPTHVCPDPELSREQLLAASKWAPKARRGFITDPNERVFWEEALGQVKRGRLNGPCRFDKEGRLMTADGPKLANPAFGSGVQQGEKLRVVGDLKRARLTGRRRLRRQSTFRRGAMLQLS